MPSNFETLTQEQLQPRPIQNQTREQYGVYVVPAIGNGVILTQEGSILRGLRALPGGAESNALAEARAKGLSKMSAAGPLKFSQEQSILLNGVGYVIEPSSDGRGVDYAQLGFETHHVDELYELHVKLGQAAKTAESFRHAHRHQALLRSFGQFAIDNATRGY